MAEGMDRTEAVLAQNIAILAQVQQHLGLPPIPLTLAAVAATGSQAPPPTTSMVIPVVAVADSALAAPLAANPLALAQS